MDILFAAFTWVEIGIFCVAGMALFSHLQYRFSECVVYSIVTTLILLSCLIQCAFLIGYPPSLIVMECVWGAGSIVCIVRYRSSLIQQWKAIKHFVSAHLGVSLVLLICWSYLAIQAFLLPPFTWDSMVYHLSRVLIFQQENSFFTKNVNTWLQACFPLGADVLFHLFLRAYTDYGVALFSFLSYLTICIGSYALARRYTSPSNAICIALIIASLPLLVYQSISTKNDILSAAISIFCLIAAHRLLSTPNRIDLVAVVMGLFFGLSMKITFFAFAFPFAFFLSILLISRYGVRTWISLLLSNKKMCVGVLLGAVFVSHSWFYAYNYYTWGGWFGPSYASERFTNHDGIVGAVANMTRNLFASAHFLVPTDHLTHNLFGFRLSKVIQNLYETIFDPLWGDAGMRRRPPVSFSILWKPEEQDSWFGPLSFLILLPSIFYVLFRGSGLLRVTAVTLLAYSFFIFWKICWMPWNNRFFSLFFAASCICAAFAFERINLRTWFRRVILALSISILFFSCAFNSHSPLFHHTQIDNLFRSLFLHNPLDYRSSVHSIPNLYKQHSVWEKTHFGRDRYLYARWYYGDRRIEEFKDSIPQNSRVAVLANKNTWIYHFMLLRPDICYIFKPVRFLKDGDYPQKYLNNCDFLLCIERKCGRILGNDKAVTVWQSEDDPHVRYGKLFRLR